MAKDDKSLREKKWPLMYTRSEKMRRAKQLGMEYPRKPVTKSAKEMRVHVLFICSKNKWRSPTAEKVFSKHEMIVARSKGTSSDARRKVTSSDLKWADIVLVMEQKHKQRLRAEFPGETKFKEIHVLDVPDEYRYMDQELVEIFQEVVPPLIENA